MRQVAILGIGQTRVDEHWDKSLKELGGEACFAAMQDGGMKKVEALFVGNMLSPLVSGQNQLGTFLSDWVGLWGNEAVKVEAACGSGAATDTIAVHSRKDPLFLSAAHASARRAYEMAGITPQDIDLFELHDAFSIMTALSLEASGFAERGQGPRLGLDNEIRPNGRVPVCTRGGLKARGHPVGATGMYQIVEVVQQLRGECGQTQVSKAKVGMAQNIGGSGATVLTHILKVD